jgi:hypothetical protein
MEDFDGKPMYSVTIEDGSKEWKALAKSLERSGDGYHRVPAADGCSVIITTAQVGEKVADHGSFVAKVVGEQPVDKRRMTSVRPWKGAGSTSNDRWKREGTTRMALDQRLNVYKEEGCDPVQDKTYLSSDIAHDLHLPEADSEEMRHLARRLDLERDDPPPEGSGKWDQAAW